MKKLLCNFMAIGLAFTPISTLISCSSSSKNDSSANDNNDSQIDTRDTSLIENNITNYWDARTFLANKLNITLDDYSLDWIDSSTLRVRPNHGTDFEKTTTTLVDYKINTCYIGDDKKSLSTFSDLISPRTGEKIVLPYNSTLSSSDDTKEEANEGYFNCVQLLAGIELDTSSYTYSFESKTSNDDTNLRGIFTITSKDDKTDTVTFDVKAHAISFDSFFDTNQTPGTCFLPTELRTVSVDDFSLNGSTTLLGGTSKAPTLMAIANRYKLVNWQYYTLSEYTGDLESYYTAITTSWMQNDAVELVEDYSSDDHQGKLEFKTKYLDKFDTLEDYQDLGILKADADGYATNNVINFGDETVVSDTFFAYPNSIVQSDDGEATYEKGVCTSTPVDGIKEISSTDNDYKNDTFLSDNYKNCYQFENWSISSSLTDQEVRQAFVKKLKDITGYEIPDDEYLYNEIKVKRDGDAVFAYISAASTLYNNTVYKSMYYPGLGGVIGGMDLYEEYDKTAGTFIFKVSE